MQVTVTLIIDIFYFLKIVLLGQGGTGNRNKGLFLFFKQITKLAFKYQLVSQNNDN